MKNVKFASISDQLINTAIILDMMFNTEMIVKDMKGGKEDMTEKQFPTWTKYMSIIYVDTGKKPTREDIIEQMLNQEPFISDEEAFLRHLIRK